MSSERPILLIFDTETTGTRKDYDQIIELSVQRGLGKTAERKTWRFKPSVPISPAAQRVHGIGMADLENSPAFSRLAPKLVRIFDQADIIVGYYVTFDLEMLQAEFQRTAIPAPDFTRKLIVDPYRLWQHMEPRTLQDAHRRFLGAELGAAHSAEADVEATGKVLRGMLKAFDLTDRTWEELADLCEPGRRAWIGPSRHLQWRAGVPIIAFGKHSGLPLHELATGPDASYLGWMLDEDFPEHVKQACDEALRCSQGDLVQWLVREFGPPPDDEVSVDQ